MVRSRFSSSNTARATRVFTDREGPRETFERTLAELSNDSPKLVSYYGIGGIGKSRLCRELYEHATSGERKGDRIAIIDLAVPELRDFVESLFAIRRQIARPCVVYDCAVVRWWSLLGRPLNGLRPKLGRNDGDVLAGVLDWLAESGGDAIVGATVVPGFTLLKKIAEAAGQALRRRLSENRDLLLQMEDLSLNQITERLPYYLAVDLQSLAREGRVILFFDSYEKLWLSRGGELRARDTRTDQWVRDLIAPAKGVAVFIFSRRRLDWDQVAGEGWQGVLEEHLLGELSLEDSDRFLRAVPISDGEIRSHIIEVSKGLPFLLDLCVDIFEEFTSSGNVVDADSFGGTRRQVLDRAIDHLSLPAQETIRLLAVPRSFDRRLFRHVVREFSTGYPETAFAELTDRSFFVVEERTGRARFHDLMREHLLAITDAETRREVSRAIVKFLRARDIPDTYEALEIFGDAVEVLDWSNLDEVEWLFGLGRDLYGAGYWRELSDALGSDWRQGVCMGPVEALVAGVERRIGNPRKAMISLERLINGQFSSEVSAFARFELADATRLLGDFDKALEMYTALAKDPNVADRERVRSLRQSADILMLRGRFRDSQEMLSRQLKKDRGSGRVDTLRQMGHNARFNFLFNEAHDLYEEALSLAKARGDIGAVGKLLTNLVETNAMQLAFPDLGLAEKAIHFNRDLGSLIEEGKCLAARGIWSFLAGGTAETSLRCFGDARSCFDRSGYVGGRIVLEWYEGLVSFGLQDEEGTRRHLRCLEEKSTCARAYQFLAACLCRVVSQRSRLDEFQWFDREAVPSHLERISRRLSERRTNGS
ncbi:MAG: tetratricopeptide repeat protein [Acidobacteria bacterium]|nr:tetratricopeptide repeat protein [Acidobacteriota bacterium]